MDTGISDYALIASRRDCRLLVVDDDPLACMITSGLIGMAMSGASIECIDDASQALARCKAERFDCVLVDYDMPGINGVEFLAGIRLHDQFMPILLCTGVGSELLAADAMKLGVSDYLPKAQLSVDRIGQAIASAIERADKARLIAAQHEDLEIFASALAHDFRQPLRQLMTFSQLAMEEASPPPESRLAKLLDFIGAAAGRLDHLVDALSQFALLSGRPELEPVDVEKIVDDLRVTLEAFIDRRNGRISLEGASAVLGHEALLSQVLQNLIVNGLTYNKSNEPTVTINCRNRGNHVELLVADNGLGVERAFVDRIFEPLARLHGRNEYEGAGIGLTLARKAMTAMNGSIHCYSDIGEGTTFALTLPGVPAQARLPRAWEEFLAERSQVEKSQ